MGIYVVVANQFEDFARHGHVLSYSTLLQALKTPGAIELKGSRIIAGQGLGRKEIQHAYRLAVDSGYGSEFEHWHMWSEAELASEDLSHKRHRKNVLISIPDRTDEGVYTASLLLHAENELMLDHLTGQHVQGMVLLEACRQMFLAVTERFHLDDYAPQKRYFVLNEMSVRYTAFAFPLPAQIRYRLLHRKQPRADRVEVQAQMEVWQDGKLVTEVDVAFSVMDAERLGKREATLAERAISSHVSSLRQRLRMPPRADVHVMTEPISPL
ncbi:MULTISPECIES: AfsA-related hotdog domain-containing protein [Pseudomonas]|uniref:AfsA-related hotdog domain-containing protein n=1 Tax=Pseudomonas TaxID=286 RepID=UPI002362ABB7|nr:MULTISPECIES: AfsA-related hotdog domain-containing protein [Pseudomonas]WJV25514.1 AfsA-related hotdog domain-containing protein [Pseudomonas chlororaphis]